MPDWNNPAFWETVDRLRDGHPTLPDGLPNPTWGQILSYLDGRAFADALRSPGITENLYDYRRRLANLGAVPNFSPSTDVLIVGCGFGWLIEVLIDVGANRVWGTDTSTVVQGSLADPNVDIRSDVQAQILNIDVTAPDALQQFRSAGAGGTGQNRGRFDWLVTELFVESFDPINNLAAFNAVLNSLEALRSNRQGGVAHIVTVNHGGAIDDTLGFTWLTLAEWAAIRPSHWWIDLVTGEIAGGQ